MALAHTISNAAEAAYTGSDLFGKRRKLMNACAEFLNTLPRRYRSGSATTSSSSSRSKAIRGVTIALVSSRERKRRQPGLATDDPAFVGWHQLVRGIQGS
jgi:hypothetical protein